MSSLSDPGLHLVALGNRFRGDDGVAARLITRIDGESGVVCHDWGEADALTIAHDLLELDAPVLVVDCANMGLTPGEWRLFDESALRGYGGNSTHGLGLADALELVRELGFDQPLHCFGVEPADLSDRDGLSPELETALTDIEVALRQSIERLQGRVAA